MASGNNTPVNDNDYISDKLLLREQHGKRDIICAQAIATYMYIIYYYINRRTSYLYIAPCDESNIIV